MHYSRTLPVFKVLADDVSGCRKLHLLEGAHHISELQILSLENARCLEEARKAKLADKHNLSELTLDWTVGVDRHLEDSDLLGQLASATKNSGTLVSRRLQQYRLSRLGHGHFSLPHLEELSLDRLPSITKTGWEFCGGKGAFRRLSNFKISFMEGLEEWSTAYYAEEGVVEEFMFPVLELDSLTIKRCPRLMLKPCPPTFRECRIEKSDQVLSSFEEVRKINHHTSSSRATNLHLHGGMQCQSMEIFHHFSALQELTISCYDKLIDPILVRMYQSYPDPCSNPRGRT